MKNILLIITFIAAAVQLHGQDQPAPQPLIEIIGDSVQKPDPIHDGEVITMNFRIRNAGNDVLKIHQIWPACGCTVPVLSDSTLMPGDTGTIRLDFNSKGYKGLTAEKYAIILSNAPEKWIWFVVKVNEPLKPEEDRGHSAH